MDPMITASYHRILKSELVAAMGCTEPIAIAYAAAKAREGMHATAIEILQIMLGKHSGL